MRSTNIRLKEKYFPLFSALVKEQLEKGAKKYAGNEDAEWTDVICSVAGSQWILGTILKYVGRIANGDSRAKEDIVKIATYAYLYWLKMFSEEFEE